MANFNPQHKEVLDQMLLTDARLHPGKMFGFPAYYAGKRMCICLYEQGVGVKLPASTVADLLQSDANIIPFQPYGKAVMREWVQINLTHSEDYRKYKAVFEQSIAYVYMLKSTPKV